MDEDGAIIEQRVINQQYKGDVAAYKRVMAEKRKGVFSWDDIYASAMTLPDYEDLALRFIKSKLGDLARQITLADEPFIRHAIYQYEREHGDFEKLCTECQIHLKQIINKFDEN